MQEGRRWRLVEFVRIDNLADRSYGSVIVNETNSRFYEPAPGRNITLGIQANLQF
jgi:iron complex outermembrane receptor protein